MELGGQSWPLFHVQLICRMKGFALLLAASACLCLLVTGVSSTGYSSELGMLTSTGSNHFGTSVAFESTSFVVVGQPGSNQVRVLDCSTSCTLKYNFTGSDSVSGDQFGASVAVSGTFVAVGAPGKAGGGKVYFFNTTTSSSTPLASATSAAAGNFGSSVSLLGTTIVAGSPNGSPAGAVTLLDCSSFSSCTAYNVLPSTALTAGDNFGFSVSIASISFVAVGASGNNGTVYLFDCTSFTCTQGAALASDGNSTFGFSVAASGTSVLVGAPGSSIVAAYFYDCSSSSSCPNPVELSPSGVTAAGQYGTSVSLDGSTAAVGSTNRVDVFYCSGSSCGVITSNITSNITGLNAFGSSVAVVQPDLLLVGAPNQASLAGAIFLYGNISTPHPPVE